MMSPSPNDAYSEDGSQVLWEDGERSSRRGWRADDSGNRRAVLIVLPAAGHPSRSSLDRLRYEYERKDELDETWAMRPLDLVRVAGRTMCSGMGRPAALSAAMPAARAGLTILLEAG